MELLLIIIPIILIMLSQWYINSSYAKYNEYEVDSGKTGAEAAKEILDANGLSNVKIVKIEGTLTDHFDPRTNTVSLSNDIYSGSSVAAVAVAAHECGHVIQHKEKYAPIVIRSALVPVVNIASKLGYAIMVAGVLASIFNMALIGLILMCATLIFQLVTLPTEFDASNRAKKQLVKLGIITKKELSNVSSMLYAAAMTYLASFFASFAQMLRLFLQINRRNN
ncbi:MAG: zinc metallopeptidase [Bacilli bacterium]|nr:zinc metallopeptidase [Bacilli bacterium]